MPTVLTEKQRVVWEWMAQSICETGHTPTVRELCDHFHVRTATMVEMLERLENKGYITRTKVTRRPVLCRWPDVDLSAFGPGTMVYAMAQSIQKAIQKRATGGGVSEATGGDVSCRHERCHAAP